MCAVVTKTIVRGLVIGALAGGTLAIVFPARTAALAEQAKASITSAIDSNIDDPVALRAQIKSLEAEYPRKIAEVRRDLAEVQTQVAQLERELTVSRKVVDLAQADLANLDGSITRARAAQAEQPGAIVRIAFNNERVELPDAYAARSQVERTLDVYQNRATELETDLGYLTDQEDQLATLLNKLETERADFQAQLFQLDAQIDAIARNDRLITMIEDRQKTIDEHSRYEAHSLRQIEDRLAAKRSEQRARLEAATSRDQERDYEDVAEYLIDRAEREARGDKPAPALPEATGATQRFTPSAAPVIIDIDADDASEAESTGPIVSR